MNYLYSIRKIHGRISDSILEKKKKAYLNKKRNKLKNHDFSIISNNCIAGIMYHDLNMRFSSPTINLWLPPEDYMLFLLNLNEAISAEVFEYTDSEKKYPVGYILLHNKKRILIHFMHYPSFKIAKQKWDERKARINWENLFVLFETGKDSSDELINDFLALPYNHLFAITNNSYHNSKRTIALDLYDKEDYVNGKILLYKPFPFEYKRYLDDFDYVQWINQCCNNR